MRKDFTIFIKRYGYRILAIGFWLLFWEIMSRIIKEELLLAPPIVVFRTLFDLGKDINFWLTIGNSSVRIVLGFLIALLLGILLASCSYINRVIYEIISPAMKVIKAVPVASFIILALIWIKSKHLSILVSFMMVLPMIYTSVFIGLRQADQKLLEMAEVFHISPLKRIIAIYIPAIKPHLISAISVGLGFCFKAGIAAEVIGIPKGSIGRSLYEAKLYFMTKEIMAWTVVIIIISILFEQMVLYFIIRLEKDKKD